MLEGRKSFPSITLKEYQKVHLSLCAQIMTFILDAVQLPILVAVGDCAGHGFFSPGVLALIIKPFVVIYVDLQLLLCDSVQPIS